MDTGTRSSFKANYGVFNSNFGCAFDLFWEKDSSQHTFTHSRARTGFRITLDRVRSSLLQPSLSLQCLTHVCVCCVVCLCSDNQIGDEGARVLGDALRTNTTLTELGLGGK